MSISKLNIKALTPASTSKFLLAAFVRVFAQKVTAEICPMQVFVRLYATTRSIPYFRTH
tara:strand:+ start:6663 stop:6839 length:177 start_codon:yes stop_codon:yes gene_type:complete